MADVQPSGSNSITGLYAAASAVPTLGELCAGAYRDGSASAAQSIVCFIAPFPCNVTQASVDCHQGGVVADDTNFYTAQVRRIRAGAIAIIATKTTKITGGEAITQRKDWNFDTATFDPTNMVLAKGDIIDIAFTPSGAPATPISSPFVQVRYEPI